MRIGIPKEIKNHEGRVPLLAHHVESLVAKGHEVLIQEGVGSAIDEDYKNTGAKFVTRPEEIWASDLIVKVKEPQLSELAILGSDSRVFGFMHFASNPYLLPYKDQLLAFEEVEYNGYRPILAPMSQIAGSYAAYTGLEYVMKYQGIWPGGTVSVLPAKVLVLGAGIAGSSAADVALGIGADVTVADIDERQLRKISPGARTIHADAYNIRKFLPECDLVIGAVFLPKKETPKVLLYSDLGFMKVNTIFVDISIDQGGCAESSRPTTHSEPVYKEYNVWHYCVTNIPGIVPKTSSQALAIEVFPELLKIPGI